MIGSILKIAKAFWEALMWWRKRPRLMWLRMGESLEAAVERDGPMRPERSCLLLGMKNGPEPLTLTEWGVEKPRSGSGPLFVETTDFPIEVGPYDEASFVIWNPELFPERDPRVIFVKDKRGKRFKMKRKYVPEAREIAARVIKQNRERGG